MLSDSGTITEESSIFNFPALNIREALERPEGMQEGAVVMARFNVDRILPGRRILDDRPGVEQRTVRVAQDYSAPNVSDKVFELFSAIRTT